MNEGSLDALEARLGATTEWIRVCWCGLNGVWKCKMVARGALATLVQRGVGLTKADPGLILASDSCAWGSSVGEVRLLPEWSTLRVLPHCPSHAAVYGTADWALDARRFLGAQLARLHERHGLSVRAAFEEEFYLLRGSDAEGWKPLDSTTYASVDALQRAWPVLDAMTRALTAQGIAIELLHAEVREKREKMAVATVSGYDCAHAFSREAVNSRSFGLTKMLWPLRTRTWPPRKPLWRWLAPRASRQHLCPR